MLSDRIRAWLTGPGEHVQQRAAAQLIGIGQTPSKAEPFDHVSRGLQQFLQTLPDRDGLSILDLGEVNQHNVAFVTGFGHRHCSEDLLGWLDTVLAVDQGELDAGTATRIAEGLLRFPDGQFDAVLIWDTFQFLPEPLVEAILLRLLRVVRPGGGLFAVFQSEARQTELTCHSFRILDARTLRLVPKGTRPVRQTFSNRSLERLFERCASMKFFLTRDSLKEVLVRR